MLIAALGPEWVTAIAGAQWSIARRSVNKYRKQHRDWTQQQAHFADMGGIHLKLSDSEFPITSDMLLKLLEKKIVKLPTIEDQSQGIELTDTSESTINTIPVELPDLPENMTQDRSKVDILAKSIAFLQTAWFVVQCRARRCQGLYITSLELSTVAFVVCTIGTMILWWSKLSGVMMPTMVSLNVPLAKLLDKEPDPSWIRHPLEQLDDISLTPSLHISVQPFLRYLTFWKKKTELSEYQKQQRRDEEKARFRDDRLPPAPRDWPLNFYLADVSMLFGAVYVAGWNIRFPTTVELILWRVAICSMLGGVVGFWAVDLVLKLCDHLCGEGGFGPGFPIKIALCAIITVVYTCCRLFLIIEMFASLRELPVSAYHTIKWTSALPHLS